MRRILIALFILLSPAAADGQLRAAVSATDERAIGLVLDDFHAAAAAADFARYFGHFTRDAVFLGTDATERWTVQDFEAYARPYFRPGGGWTYRPRDRHVTVAAGGRFAFFDELLDNDALGVCRGSGVMVREGEVWKVAQYDLSIPIPNERADSVVKIIRR